jgi:hypothetical protein
VIGAPRPAALRHPHGTAAAAFALLALFLFAPAVLGQRVFFQRDILSYWYPHLENAVQAIGEGAWPVWTPYVAFGRPLLADPSLQLLYPPTWLNLLMSPATYYALFAVTHVWGAGFGAYRLGHRLGLPPAAAGLAGAAWMASGPLLSAVNLFHHFAGAAWIPWTLLMVARALARPSLGSSLALGAVAGGQALAGSADMCLMTALAAALFAAVSWRGGPGTPRQRLAALVRVVAVGGVFAAMLAAVQWLPAFRLMLQGTRAAQNFSVITTWSVHPGSLLDVLIPTLVADLPVRPEVRALLFDGRRPFLLSLYFGIGTLPLVALSLAGPAHVLRRWALGALAVFLLAALGRHTPAAAALFAVPPLSVLRYPAKYMMPAALFWSLLAGRGLQVWTEAVTTAARRRAAWVAASGGLLALALGAAALRVHQAPGPALEALIAGDAAAVWRDAAGKLAWAAGVLAGVSLLLALRARSAAAAGWLTAACGALVLTDLAAAGRPVNRLAAPALVHYRPATADRIISHDGLPRLHVRQENADQLAEWLSRGAGGGDTEEGRIVGMHDLLVPPIGARWRIAGSYDGDFTGLAQRGLTLFTLVLSALGHDALGHKLLRIGAVTHVTSLREAPYPGLEARGEFTSVFTRPVRLYRVTDPLPRLYVVGGARPAATENIAMAIMAQPQFDPRREVILPDGADVHASPAGFAGTVQVTSRGMDRLGVDVELSAPGWMVVVEAHDPGWRARLDGTHVEVLPANALFRAVPIPAGRHHVAMSYHPPGLPAGALLSAAAVLTGLSAGAAARKGRKLNGRGPRDSMPALSEQAS